MTTVMLTGRYVSARSRTRAGLVAILLGALGLALTTSAGAKDLVSETPEKVLPSDGPINAVSFNPADGRLAVLSNFGTVITVFSPNWELQHKIGRFSGGYSGNAMVFTRDGNIIVPTGVGDYSHDSRFANTPLTDPRYSRVDVFTLAVYASEDGRIMDYFPNLAPSEKSLPTGFNSARAFTSSKDGSLIAAVAGNIRAQHVLVFDGHSGLLVRTIQVPQPVNDFRDQPMSVAFSLSDTLAIGTLNGFVHLFDAKSGLLLGSIAAYGRGEYLVNALAFSPDGKLIATGKGKNSDGHLVGGVWVTRKHDLVGADIWSAAGTHVAQLVGPPNVPGGDDAPRVWSLSWSPDGSTLAAGDARGLNIWKIDNGKPVLVLTRLIQGSCYSVAYAEDGTLAAAANQSVLIFK